MQLSQADRHTDAEEISKQKLRARYRQARKALSHESRELLDVSLCANTIALNQFKHAKTLLAYYPVNGEPDILDIARAAYIQGKRVAFPISNNDCTLTFRYVNDLSQMIKGAYGIPEPSDKMEVVTDFSECICIVPGLVFDLSGHRLGYGKGYYDRFLKDFTGYSVGLVYSEFILDKLPCEPTDRAVDLMITERGIILPNERKN